MSNKRTRRSKPRNAGARRMHVREIGAVQHPQYSHGSLRGDVTEIHVLGLWDHGQPQRLRLMMPTAELAGLIANLGRISPVIPPPPAPVQSTPVTPPAADVTPSGAPASLLLILDRRLARLPEGQRAAFLSAHLRKASVDDVSALTAAQLADALNELGARDRAARARARELADRSKTT